MHFRDGGSHLLDADFVAELTAIETQLGYVFDISSGYRDGGGCHGEGKAVDIACKDSSLRWKILKALVLARFRRIGVYDGHIHVDVCEEPFAQDVIWVGVSR